MSIPDVGLLVPLSDKHSRGAVHQPQLALYRPLRQDLVYGDSGGVPPLTILMQTLAPEIWPMYEMYVLLVLILGGLFIPIVVVGKKYE